jgi:hypothetical protein
MSACRTEAACPKAKIERKMAAPEIRGRPFSIMLEGGRLLQFLHTAGNEYRVSGTRVFQHKTNHPDGDF